MSQLACAHSSNLTAQHQKQTQNPRLTKPQQKMHTCQGQHRSIQVPESTDHLLQKNLTHTLFCHFHSVCTIPVPKIMAIITTML